MSDHADPVRQLNDFDDDGTARNTCVDAEGVAVQDESRDAASSTELSGWRSPMRLAGVAGSVIAVSLTALVGWLGYNDDRQQRADDTRALFVEVAKQGAVNLTTVNYTEVDKDVARILDSATGTFRDDFQKRAQPFVDVVKQVRSISTGTVTDAGLESQSGDQAQVLVSVAVKTAIAGAPEQQARHWRMRINVQKNGAEAKVSNVLFVP